MKLTNHPTPWTVKQHGTRKMTVREAIKHAIEDAVTVEAQAKKEAK